MTDISKAAVDVLLQGVTAGPWQADSTFMKKGYKVRVALPDRLGVPDATIAKAYENWKDEYGDKRISWKAAEANARFIAAARELVPALRAALDEAEAERDAANAVLRQIVNLTSQHGGAAQALKLIRTHLGAKP